MMSETESTPSFTITPDREARLIRYKMEGLWDLDMLQKYKEAMTAEMKAFQAAGISYNLLGDLTRFNAQRQDLNDERQEMVKNAMALGLNKCAVVVSSQIVKMQLGRLSNNAYAFFTSEQEAMDWLAT